MATWLCPKHVAHSPAPGLCTFSSLCLQRTAQSSISLAPPTATPQIPTLCPGMPPVPLTHPNAYPAPPRLGGDHSLWTSHERLFTWPWPPQKRILISLGLLLWHWSKHILKLWKFEIVCNGYAKRKENTQEKEKFSIIICRLPLIFHRMVIWLSFHLLGGAMSVLSCVISAWSSADTPYVLNKYFFNECHETFVNLVLSLVFKK